MAGRLVYVMGPSGGGKDTVLQGVAGLLGSAAYLAPRVVTRPESATEANAQCVSEAEFEQLESCGALAMSWRANGHAYGIRSNIDDMLGKGLDVLVNGSRDYLPVACKRYPQLLPVLLDVPAPLLKKRLQTRGRENALQIRQRLARNAQFAAMDNTHILRPIIRIDNSGTIENALRALHSSLLEHGEDQQGFLSCA